MGLRIGYHFHGFLADRKLASDGSEVSAPDGNATYSWAIVHEAVRRGHTVVPLGVRRDTYITAQLGREAFRAFSKRMRSSVYDHLMWGRARGPGRRATGWGADSDQSFPELDLVLLEWRWPIPGRNTLGDRGSALYQGDLERQEALLRHYVGRGVPVIAWDLDHKLTEEDERTWGFNAVFETAVSPRRLYLRRTRVEPPFVTSELGQFFKRYGVPKTAAAYVGSRYERDDVLDEWIGPLARSFGPGQVHLHGKWEPPDECRRRWPGVVFHGRIGVSGFQLAYRNAAVCPLLAKRSYFECGFVTPRPYEALLFGSLPVGLGPHLGVDPYSFAVAPDPTTLRDIAQTMKRADSTLMRVERERMADRLRFMDATYFVDALERAHAQRTDRIDETEGQ